MELWLTLEVQDAETSAHRWRDARGQALVEAALTHGARSWAWQEPRWGLILEVGFSDEAQREGFRQLPAVRAALDSAPDPVSGVLVYPGRGGSYGAAVRVHPRPSPSEDAAHAVAPTERLLDLTDRQPALT